MSANGSLGALVQSFFLDHLICVKGLRPASVRSYRDTVRLFLGFVAAAQSAKTLKSSEALMVCGIGDVNLTRAVNSHSCSCSITMKASR